MANRYLSRGGFLKTVFLAALSLSFRLAQAEELHNYDKHLCRERHLVECFIGKIKHYRRIFSRFEKLARRYLGFLSLVGAPIWLPKNVNRA